MWTIVRRIDRTRCWQRSEKGERSWARLCSMEIERYMKKNSGLGNWVQPVLDVIKASTVIIYGHITTVNHSPCYKTFLRSYIMMTEPSGNVNTHINLRRYRFKDSKMGNVVHQWKKFQKESELNPWPRVR